MSSYSVFRKPTLSQAVLLGLLLLVLTAPHAAAQTLCDGTRLEQAVNTYDFGRFGQTFALLKPCVPEGFAEKRQRISAYRLMALAYVATDSLEQARTWVRKLLKADSRFAPDPQVDPLLFTDLVRDLKPKWYTFLWKGNAWYKWVGRGVVVGGLVSLPLLLRDNTPPDLPGHPGLPPG